VMKSPISFNSTSPSKLTVSSAFTNLRFGTRNLGSGTEWRIGDDTETRGWSRAYGCGSGRRRPARARTFQNDRIRCPAAGPSQPVGEVVTGRPGRDEGGRGERGVPPGRPKRSAANTPTAAGRWTAWAPRRTDFGPPSRSGQGKGSGEVRKPGEGLREF
jgi:hypothetical protein